MSKLLSYCPLCTGTHIEQLYEASDPHYGIPGSYRVVRCTDCSLVFLNPMFSDEELTALYPPDYYAYRDEVKATLWKERAKRALGYWQGTKDPHFDKPGRFLDIGCGSGTFVQRMWDAGWSSYGVEVSEPAAKLAQSRNLQVFWGRLQDAHFPSESFDSIRASHSLEHMTCPHESIDEIHRLLKPGGRLLIAIPNLESLSARIFREHWYHLCPPVHAFNYSGKTLGRMLSMHGFRPTNVVFNSHYAGMVGSLQIWLNRKNGKESSEGSLYDNRALRVVSGRVENLCDLIRIGDMIEVTAVKARSRASQALSGMAQPA